MKTKAIISSLLICSSLFSQTELSDLKTIANKLKNSIQIKTDSLNLIESQIEEARKNKFLATPFDIETIKTVEIKTWKMTKFTKDADMFSECIDKIPEGKIIELIDYDSEKGYWFIKFDNYVGFINDVLVKRTTESEELKRNPPDKNKIYRLNIQKEIQAIEDKKIAKAQEIKDQKTAEIEKKKQALLAEQSSEERRIAIERKKRKEAIIRKYGQEIGTKINSGRYWIGMTSEMAKESLGYPDKNNRTVGEWGVHEQWVYDKYDIYLYFKNDILSSYQN